MEEEAELYLNGTLSDDGKTPLVYWKYRGREGVISLEQARKQAKELFTAASVAQSEGALLKAFQKLDAAGKGKGFGKSPRSQLPIFVLKLAREERPPISDNLQVIFGHNTQIGLVDVGAAWYGERIQLSVEEAYQHASQLIEAAEVSESDAFFYWFLQSKINCSLEEAYVLIQEFAVFRATNRLEELFKRS